MRRLAVSVFLGLLAACAAPMVSFQPRSRTFTPDDYWRVYELWTRESRAFAWGKLSDVLSVTATFESWEFRTAYLVRYADDHGLSVEERDALLAASLEDAGEYHRFFITLVGPNFRESDLTNRRAAFRVLMVDDDEVLTPPALIERVHRPSPAERIYFPSVTSQRMTFRVAFPSVREDGSRTIAEGAERVRLRFTGAEGRVELEWVGRGGATDLSLPHFR